MKRIREADIKEPMAPAAPKPITTAELMLECVRQSGRWNMFTDWKRACLSAFALSVYLGQPLGEQSVHLEFNEFMRAYEDKAYAKRVADQVAGLPCSPTYVRCLKGEAGFKKKTDLGKTQPCDFKALIREAEEACIRWAREARDVGGESIANDEKAEIEYGAWHLLCEGDLATHESSRLWLS
jgi:hypothetical protein